MFSPVDTYKSRVRAAFSRHAGTYDANAGLQAHAADYSAELLGTLKEKSAIPGGKILEIGCGTGLFTNKLLKLFPEHELTCCDLSSEMLSACKLRLGQKVLESGRISFEALDAEELKCEASYSLIASSFSLQWFFHPMEGINKLLNALVPGGVMFFSVPGDESCKQWKAACERLDIPFTRNPLPKLADLQGIAVRKRMEFRLYDHFVEETHPDAVSMLRALKELGAGTQRNNIELSCLELRSLLRELDSESKPLSTSYQVIAGYFRKVHNE